MKKNNKELEQQWKKEYRRLQQAMRRAEKLGIRFLSSPLPPKPKRITEKSVQRLRKTTPLQIRKKGVVTSDDGELTPYRTAKPEITTHRKLGEERVKRPRPKKQKPRKSAEELHETRVTAGKKAAATRKRHLQERQASVEDLFSDLGAPLEITDRKTEREKEEKARQIDRGLAVVQQVEQMLKSDMVFNPSLCEKALEELFYQIEQDLESLYFRLATASDMSIELATRIAFGSYQEAYTASNEFILLIRGGELTDEMQKYYCELMEESESWEDI